MRTTLLCSLILASTITSINTFGQISYGGIPISYTNFSIERRLPDINTYTLQQVDNDSLQKRAESITRECDTCGKYYWGFGIDIEIDIIRDASIINLENGRLYLFKLVSKDAYSLQLYFERFRIPEGAELFIFNENRTMFLGSFNSSNNKEHGKLALQPISGSAVIIEYFVPYEAVDIGELELSMVIHDFVNILESKGPYGTSGSCNINVKCSLGSGWENEISSVAIILYLTSSGLAAQCSGALINNTTNNGRQYFLTANHCADGTGTKYQYWNWVFLFNHQASSCTGSTGPTTQSISGSSLLANGTSSDYLLLLLDEQPPSSYNTCYSGWDRSVSTSTSYAVCVHHPAGDIKKISKYNSTPNNKDWWTGCACYTHWEIPKWDLGSTTGGSSGSPLFNQDKRIIGQCHYGNGYPDCDPLKGSSYGKFSRSWAGGSFEQWLDPSNSGASTCNTHCPINPCLSPYNISSCGSAGQVTFSSSGYGSWHTFTNSQCGYGCLGKERIYKFVAPYTGIYSIQVTAASGWVDYLWRSNSCDQFGWNCIDDINSSGNYGSMSWTAGTTYYLLLDFEEITSGSHSFYIICPTPPNPCNSIVNINGCGSSYSKTYTGGGTGTWFTTTDNACNYPTPGTEQIYSFTAPTTGTYSIQVTAASGYVDYLWKSGSCSSSGWNCIDDITSTGQYGSMSWNAGTTYYILLDDEDNSAGTHSFYINCPTPPNPCNSIVNIAGCGSSYAKTYTGGGTGAWFTSTDNPCNYETPGNEQIYSFTAPTTGTYSIQVTAASGYVDYLWKSGSCSSSGWNCIDDINSTGQYGSMSWNAGTTYYILLDDEDNSAGTHTFYINCCTLPGGVSVNGGGTFCNSTILTASGGSGGTIYYQGTTSNGTSTSTPSTSRTVTSSGTYYFRAYNTCGWGPQGSATVTINTVPGTVTVNGGGTHCSSATLTASGGSGGTIYWQGTTSNGTSTSTPSTSQTVTSSGTYYFRAYNACGWGTQGSATVTINTAPSAVVVNGSGSYCSSATLTANGGNGGTIYWQGTTNNGTSTSTPSTSQTVTSSGTYYFRAYNTCGWGPQGSAVVTINALPGSVSVTGGGIHCNSATLIASGGSGGTIYWQGTTSNGTSTSTPSTSQTVTSSGTYYFRAYNACGWGTQGSATVSIINSTPAQPGPISGEANPCTGNSYTYSITAVPGASSYAWSYSGTGTPTGTGISCTLIPTSSGNLSVMAGNACGNSPSSNKSLTINTVPGPVGSITFAGGVCEGTSYTASVSPVQGATSYTWTLPPGWTGNSTTNTISGTVGSAGIIIVSANNTCGSSPSAPVSVSPNPLPSPVTVSGSGTFCNTATLTASGGSGGTIYWQGTTSNGTAITTPSTSQTITTSGTYYFRAKNACGWGQQGSATVTIKTAPPPIPDPISGPVNPCINSETSYSTNPVTDAIAYNWSYTGGGTPSGSGSSCTLIPTSGGILSVAATNVCGAGSARQLTLSPVNLPPQPGVISGSNTPASGGTYIYEISPVSSAASYTWSYSGTGTLNPSTTTSCTLVPTGNGTLSVVALNACGTGQASTLALTMSLLPAPPDSIYGTPIPCFGTPYTYTIQPVNGAISYEWRFTVQGSGTTNTVGTGLTCILSPSSSGTLSVFAINNAGSSQAKTLTIQLITAPTRPNLIQGPTDPCLGIANQYMVDPVPYATHYTWTWSGGGTITGTSNQCILIPSTNGILAVIAHNTCGTSQDRTKALGLSYIPPLPGIISGQPTPYSIPYNYQIDPVTYATSYAWSYTGQGTLVENGTGCTLTPFTSGVLSVRAINGCGASNARTKAIDVIPTPGTPGPITGSSSPCAGTSQTYLISSVPLALSYYWSFTGGGVPISPGTSCTFTPTSSGILSVVASNLSGASTASSFEITIQALPIQPGSISGPNSVSPGAQPSYSITPMSGITSYSWSLPTSWTGSSTTSTITPTVGNIGGQVCVTAHNGCGQGPSRCVEVSLAAANQYTISGMLRYKNNLLSPIGSSSIRLFDSNNTLIATSTTNASGSFQFTGLANNTYTLAPSLTKPWGGVTAMDLTRYRQVIANIDTIAPMSQFHKKAGDVNKSNHLSITDLIWMRNRISFNVDSFPAGDWLYDSTEVVVQGANVSRNIYALCFGDGNGSFTPAAKSSFPELLQSSSQIMTVTDPNYITLPLIVNKGIDVASITMDIEYRDDLLNFIEASVSQYNQELVYHQVGNKIRLVFSSLSPLSTGAGNALASLSFKSNLPLPQNPVQAISSVQAELGDLANQQIQGVYISVPKIAGGISTNIENFLPAYDFKVYPNPFNDYLEVTFSLNVPSEVIIEMFDYAGKLIQRKALSTLKADKHHFLLNTSTYEDGVYFIKLRTRSDHDEFNQVKRAILISK